MSREVVVATRSSGKWPELRDFLLAGGFVPRSLTELGVPQLPAEDELEAFDSFEENARAKVRYFAALCGGRSVLAEDSGIVVDALGGAPGVRSRRWGWAPGLEGEALDAANNRRLLAALEGASDRRARYVCVAIWRDPAGREWVARGECAGLILRAPLGTRGFGYDPLFYSEELGACLGVTPAEEKARVSHRGRAMSALMSAVAGR